MIYVIDQPLQESSHSMFMKDLIGLHSKVEVNVISLDSSITITNLVLTIDRLKEVVKPKDIVLCAWVVSADTRIDSVINDLADLCWVVVAAGNYSSDISNFSPARASNVITVGCLNKSGKVATLSNTSSDKDLEWVPGTNCTLNGKTESGTSVSAALYAAFLSNSLDNFDCTIEQYIEEYKNKVLLELK